MKARLLGGTALIGAAALLVGGTAEAAVAPMWRLTGNMNFQLYWIDQDWAGLESDPWPSGWFWTGVTSPGDATAAGPQEHDWYFGVDEARKT